MIANKKAPCRSRTLVLWSLGLEADGPNPIVSRRYCLPHRDTHNFKILFFREPVCFLGHFPHRGDMFFIFVCGGTADIFVLFPRLYYPPPGSLHRGGYPAAWCRFPPSYAAKKNSHPQALHRLCRFPFSVSGRRCPTAGTAITCHTLPTCRRCRPVCCPAIWCQRADIPPFSYAISLNTYLVKLYITVYRSFPFSRRLAASKVYLHR